MHTNWKVSRREFLAAGGAAAAAPYVISARVLGAEGQPPANSRINVCAIGIKNRGRGIMGGCLGDARTRVVAICDVDRSVRDSGVAAVTKHYGGDPGVKGYNDFREVMARPDIDAVLIATPDHSHAMLSIAAMKAGKDVYIEKPMTYSILEGRVMADTAKRLGRVVQVGSQHQSGAGLARMAELVQNGRIGKVLTAYTSVACSRPNSPKPPSPQPVPDGFDYDLWVGPAPWSAYDPARCHYNFRFVRDFGTGEMGNWGGHSFSAVNLVLGKEDTGPVEVRALAGERHASGVHDAWRNFRLEFVFADGVRLLVNTGGGLKVVGDKGWISSASGGEPASMLRSTIGAGEIQIRRAQGGHMGDFIHCILTRQTPTAPVEAGHRAASLCHLGNIALDLGRPLKYDPVKEEFPGDEAANRLRWRPWRAPYTL
jgi:predicted dehydrogenase